MFKKNTSVKKAFYLLIICFCFTACKSTYKMTNNEIKLINNGTVDEPFRVLLITSKADSLFLRSKSVNVDNPSQIAQDKDLQLFIDRLELTMAVEVGVGIAAPQVGLGRNIFLFMRMDKPERNVEVAINPKITKYSEETVCFQGDGCLSIPEISGNTLRHTWIDVEYYNRQGQLVRERLSGSSRRENFTGVIFQHEFDHLQGILFTDRLCE